ncbi:MAG: PHP domain-containing protein, partial [Phycisphaerales bacterium]|nr:PHP domain-containing protein [Phycisphaerales bacterium]
CRDEPEGDKVMMRLGWAPSHENLQSHTLEKGGGGGEFFKYRAEKLREPERFVHLHNHSSYSLLDGVSSIEGIAQCAYLNGQPGIALTDHGNCFGAFRHWKACKDRGIKALMGCEIYFVENVNERYTDDDGVVRRFEHHLTLIAQDAAGWANLSKMLTVAARDHYYYVPRVDWQLLQTYSEGIICLTGCVKGPVAHFLQTRLSKEGESKLPWWNQRNLDRVVANLARLQSIFGDRLYGECMNIDYSPYAKIVPELIEFLDHFDIPRVLTNDNHYETANDAELQAMLTRISNQKVDELGGRFQKQGLYYIRDANELTYPSAPPQSWLTPDMLERTVEVMDRCSLSFDRKGYLFPPFAVEEDPMWAQFLAVRGGQGDKVTGGHGEE